jgi:RNase P subunit RPR2
LNELKTESHKKYRVKKKINKSFRFVVGGDLDDFRCPKCNALLLKGKHLEKAVIEIKCKSCGTIVANH